VYLNTQSGVHVHAAHKRFTVQDTAVVDNTFGVSATLIGEPLHGTYAAGTWTLYKNLLVVGGSRACATGGIGVVASTYLSGGMYKYLMAIGYGNVHGANFLEDVKFSHFCGGKRAISDNSQIIEVAHPLIATRTTVDKTVDRAALIYFAEPTVGMVHGIQTCVDYCDSLK
jgi:hypothetical protein